MMTKNFLFTVALASLAICAACSGNGKNGNGAARVAVSPVGQTTVGVTLTQQFTATVAGVSDQSVTWKITQNNAACSPGCGTISASGLYTAPAAPPNPVKVTVTATSVANDGESDSATANVVHISTTVSPTPSDVGVSLPEQFQAVAVPDNAPQTFTWTLTCGSGNCGTLVPDPNNNSLAIYTAPPSPPSPANSVQVTALETVDAAGNATPAKVTVLTSRLPGGSYAFRFSGHDASGAIAMAGNFLVAADGKTIQSGVEDELTASGPKQHTLTGSFTAVSNNQGTMTLNRNGASATSYTVVIDAAGDIQMVESDGTGRQGSGIIEASSGLAASALNGSFVFGFTGADSNGKRVGYAGLVAMDGSNNITSGMFDSNDNGAASGQVTVTAAGSGYTMANGIGTMTIVASGQTYQFALYGVSGKPNATTPVTLYAVSTDPIDAVHSAISGTVVFQDPKGAPYNNATLAGTAVSNLTGADSTGTKTNVALILGATNGAGGIAGDFDQNSAGTIISVKGFTYQYSSTGSGRYTVQLLGDPSASPVVPPLNFVFYASAANRGFLLESQANDPAVLTGTTDPQNGTFFAPSAIAGLYAAGTVSSGTSSVSPLGANLLLKSVGDTVTGTQFVSGGNNAVAGTYDVAISGEGTITLTAPPPPASANFVIYTLDSTRFMMLNVDKTNPDASSSIVFAQQ